MACLAMGLHLTDEQDLVDDLGCFRPAAGPQLAGAKRGRNPLCGAVNLSACPTFFIFLFFFYFPFLLPSLSTFSPGLACFGEGSEKVLELLRTEGALLHCEDYHHRYPFDWRTRQPIMMRATRQWFANVDSLRSRALQAVEGLEVRGGRVLVAAVSAVSPAPIARAPLLALVFNDINALPLRLLSSSSLRAGASGCDRRWSAAPSGASADSARGVSRCQSFTTRRRTRRC